MQDGERRFSGQLAEEYDLITLAYPDFEAFQWRMVEEIRQTATGTTSEPTQLLEIGTGNGFTTHMLLELPRVTVVTIDNDPEMVRQAREQFNSSDRTEVVEADALEYLSSREEASVDVVASAFTLHNLEREYRDAVEREIYRVLTPGGLFANADKYAPDGEQRFEALRFQVERFFDAFVPRDKLDLLRKWVTHNIDDQSPRYVMLASEAPARLTSIGFSQVAVSDRTHMQAVLTARKPR